MKLEPGQQAPDLTFVRGDGGDVSLSELWRERPLLLAFLRHFG